MPTTRITNEKLINNNKNDNNSNNNNNEPSLNIDRTTTSLSLEASSICSNKKIIKKKSFWSHSSLLNHSTTPNLSSTISNSTLLLTGKKILQNKFNEFFLQPNSKQTFIHSQSFRQSKQPTATTLSTNQNQPNETNINNNHNNINNNKTIFVKSNTMSLSERRRLLQADTLKRNKTPKTSTPNKRANLGHSSKHKYTANSYDKLFAQNVVSKDEQYSHIYKDFTTDCLKPFFDQEHIENSLLSPEPTTSAQANALNSITESADETQALGNTNTQRYVSIEAEIADSSLSSRKNLFLFKKFFLKLVMVMVLQSNNFFYT